HEELVEAAAADGAQTLGCTDRDGLYGMARHLKACIVRGMAPVVGVNFAVVWGPQYTVDGISLPAGRVTILAASAANVGYGQAQTLGAGYQALVRLISCAHTQLTRDEHPYIFVAQLAEAAGPKPVLHVLLGPESDVGRLMTQRKYTAGRARLKLWKQVLPAASAHVEIVSHLSLPTERLATSDRKSTRLNSSHGSIS